MDIDNQPATTSAACSKRHSPRRGSHLRACRQALTIWREDTVDRDHPFSAFRGTTILPDKMLTTLASRSGIKTIDDIRAAAPGWPYLADYGADVLKVLGEVDERVQWRSKWCANC